MRNATAMALAVVVACGGAGDDSLESRLEITFPDAHDGVVTYQPGGPLEVELRAIVPGLVAPTRADIAIVTDQTIPGAVTSARVTLIRLQDDTFAARGRLAWPPGGDVRVRASGVGRVVEEDISLGPSVPVSLSLAAVPGTLPPAGSLVQITVTATIAGTPVPGVPISLQIVPTAQFQPTQGATGPDGLLVAYVVVPPGAQALRVDAVSGQIRSGITLVP